MISENFETELLASEIDYFVRPTRSKWLTFAEDILALSAIAGSVILHLWLTSIGVL